MKESDFMKNHVKIIFHIDLNAFFCSCALIKEPYLKGKPFVVGGSGVTRRGVVSTASYPARKYGIGSGMSLNDAFNKYPKLLVVPVDFKLYRKYSNYFFEYLSQYSDLVLAGSIDEAYMDITKLAQTKHPLTIAKEIQTGLLEKYQLPCSIGIGPTLFLAKMASDMKKPLGITVIRKKEIVEKLFPIQIKDMFGIGKKTYPELIKMGVETIGDFTKRENRQKILGLMSEESYYSYLDHIMGRSNDVVDPNKYAINQSISNETTLNYNMDQLDAMRPIIDDLFETTYERPIKGEYVCKGVTIKVKFSDFKVMTRSFTYQDYTDDKEQLKTSIIELYEQHLEGKPVRLLGTGFSQLLLKKDLKIDINLFNYHQFTKREEKLFETKKTSQDVF